MKILLTSDWHIDARTAGVPRYEELTIYIEELVRVVLREKVDFIFHLGDFFNPGGMLVPLYTAKIINIVRAFEHQLFGESACEAMVLIAGNHDTIEDSRGPTVLSPLAAMYQFSDQVHVCERPQAFELVGRGAVRLGVLALPYVARAAYNAVNTASAFENAAKLPDIPLVVIGHQTVPGALLGSETRDMPRGRELELPTEAIAKLKPSLVANGHYHRAQTVSSYGLEIVIPGSPQRLTFGERNDTRKGYTIVEIQGPKGKGK